MSGRAPKALPWLARAGALGAAIACALGVAGARADDPTKTIAQAREATIELDVARARELLTNADPKDRGLAIERALLEIYRGNCDGAAYILSRSDLEGVEEAADLADIARGCARTTAGTQVDVDDASGIAVRFQDDEDRALLPLLALVVAEMRPVLSRELGVDMPRPIFIDVVRDQYGLSAMTGLPEEAARTTGTVAVAKWGRVTMISPRAAESGYPWLDTLAHELTHLALSRGSRDHAPLWLQEGIAKRLEIAWRPLEPTDDVPPVDDMAGVGMAKGLGRPIDKLGPSLAMLPTPEDAMVAFAEVTSFMRYWVRETPKGSLAKLLVELKGARKPDDVQAAMKTVSGADLSEWAKRWKGYIEQTPRTLPPELTPGARPEGVKRASREARLGQLLAERGHHDVAAPHFESAVGALPKDSSLRAMHAESLVGKGERERAAKSLGALAELYSTNGRWMSLHAALVATQAERERAITRALSLEPLAEPVACEEKKAPELPADPVRRALCESARRRLPRP